jgi:hypothetical protein
LNVSAEIDVSGLVKALGLAAAHSSRTTVEVINGACRDIIFKSAAQTKKADKGQIERELTRAVYTVTKSATGRLLKKPKRAYQAAELVYKLVNQKRAKDGQRGIAGKEMGQEAQKFIKKRMNASGYIAYAGWNKALIAFGGRGFGTGKTGKIQENSKAARGFGRPARVEYMIAEFVNRATKAFEIGGAVTQRIVYEKQADIVRHVEQKLAAKFRTL